MRRSILKCLAAPAVFLAAGVCFGQPTADRDNPAPGPEPTPIPFPFPPPMPESTPIPFPPPIPKSPPDPTPIPGHKHPPQSGFRVNVVDGRPDDGDAGLPATNSVVRWETTLDGVGPTEVTCNIVLQSAVEPCRSEPTSCRGDENFVTVDPAGIPTGYGCSDGIDNDGNGLTDSEDPDCAGVQGWSLSGSW